MPSSIYRCLRAHTAAQTHIREAIAALVCCCLFLLAVPEAGHPQQKQLPEKTTPQGGPYVEWSLEYPGAAGNKYDVTARATFTHEETGATKRSLMFYTGTDNAWKFRFTGARVGEWSIETEGPGSLGGWTGIIHVTENETNPSGFLIGRGRSWVWSGTNEEFVPQFVMMNRPAAFWKDGAVNTEKIARTVQEFAVETGFTGFHFSGGGGKWFEPGTKDTHERHENPAPETFEVLEKFITQAYLAGAATHIWLYGSDGYGHRSGPLNLGGAKSEASKRVLRYIAARLGPIPGWSIGYGYDLHKWADSEELTWYKNYLEEHLGGWEHLIGARADTLESLHDDGTITRRSLSAVYWTGDYAGHYDYRVPYRHYVRTYEYANKPAFQEDRFRIRENDQFQPKDYTPDMTVRGLWHSTMAGGVANIWGNLLPHSVNERGSEPYDNREQGSVRGQDIVVDIKNEIRTYATFWFENGRFSSRLVRDNTLSAHDAGGKVLSGEAPRPISVCLRDQVYEKYIFYAEATRTIAFDLRESTSSLPAVAVDTRKPYQEIDLGRLDPQHQTWTAPYESDWAIAVGQFGK